MYDASITQKRKMFHAILEDMLRSYITLFTADCFGQAQPMASDGVAMYAKELLSLCLLYSEFRDAIREGDGDRVFSCWKFFLPIFRADRKSNYAIEALTYIAQATILLPSRSQQQLLWSRFVNTAGKKGRNVAGDLHMEHLNRTIKNALSYQYSNLQPQSIVRIGRISGLLDSVGRVFDKESGVLGRSTNHTAASFTKDLSAMTNELVSAHVFSNMPGRAHSSFAKYRDSITSPLNTRQEEFITWMRNHLLCMDF